MGHNLGMRHDFEKNRSKNCWRYARRGYCIWRHVAWMKRNCKHSCKIGRGAKCDKSYNIMSYSNKSRLRWSTCSKLDFQFHYWNLSLSHALVIEPEHHGSTSILLVTFFGTPCIYNISCILYVMYISYFICRW